MAESELEIGRVRSTNPARRELRVAPALGREREFAGREWVRVVLQDRTEMRCRVADLRPGTGGFIMTLASGVTRDNVARMKGASVMIGLDEQNPRPDDAHHVSELVGLEVFDEAGECLGMVTEAYSAGANNVIEIERPGGGTMRLPAIEQVIAAVDVERGALVVRDIAPYVVEDED